MGAVRRRVVQGDSSARRRRCCENGRRDSGSATNGEELLRGVYAAHHATTRLHVHHCHEVDEIGMLDTGAMSHFIGAAFARTMERDGPLF